MSKPAAFTDDEEAEIKRLIARGKNAVAARQVVLEQRYKRRLPVPARGV